MLTMSKFVKWVGFSERNCIVKWVIPFASFCWLWDFLPENLKLIDKLQIWTFESFIFCSNFLFFFVGAAVLGRFSTHFYLPSPPPLPPHVPSSSNIYTIKKLPTALMNHLDHAFIRIEFNEWNKDKDKMGLLKQRIVILGINQNKIKYFGLKLFLAKLINFEKVLKNL